MLALATQLANVPLEGEFDRAARARSKTCGSEIAIGLELDESGRVTRIGMKVSACAVGQSSAAILANGAKGASASQITGVLNGLNLWLTGEAELPEWPGLDAIAPARTRPGRHGALLMPWQAAAKALSADDGALALSSHRASR